MFGKSEIYFFSTIILLAVCLGNSYYYDENKPVYITASVGDSVPFNCEIDFPQNMPIPYKILWKKGDEIVYSWYEGMITEADDYVGRMQLLNQPHKGYGRASVNLTSIRESDAGWFQCKIIFPNRTPSSRNNGTWIHLTVNGGNLLAIPPINKTVLEGEEASFTCITKDYAIKIRWLKDGLPLDVYQSLKTRSWIREHNTLVISPTEIGDSGEYECEASNHEGDNQTAAAFLNVQYKAKVKYAPSEILLPYGRSAIVDCHFLANPPLTNLRWEKDGFLFDPYNIQGVFYRRNGSLFISKVDDSHSGRYTCTPYNDLGTQGPSPIMHIIVQKPPVFIKKPHNLYLRKLGESIEIPCVAIDGDNGHRPIIVWYKKGGESLPLGRYSIKDGNLTIVDIEDDDRGIYICSATNKAATITAETELLVENIPSSAPYNLTAVSSPTSVHLTWLTSRHRPNVAFSVWYKAVESTEWKTYQVPPMHNLEATITNLIPEREYEFMIMSKDDRDNGIFSKSIRIWTESLNIAEANKYRSASLPPIGYPRNVTVYPSDLGLVVSWKPPEYGREYLKWYIVRWEQGLDGYLFGMAETTNNTLLIPNLEEGHEYYVEVIALSIDDHQVVSDKVKVIFPGFKSIRAVSTGVIAGLLFLTVAFAAVYYVRKKWYRPYQPETKN